MEETLFTLENWGMKKGRIYAETQKTVDVILQDENKRLKLAGQCALALQLALEADNVDIYAKAYARVKVYDSLQRVLETLTATESAETTGQLQATLNVIFKDDTPDEGAGL